MSRRCERVSVLCRLGCAAMSAAMMLPGVREATAALGATAVISTAQTSAPFNYTITLHNTGTTNIGTFWFAWTNAPRDYNFLPTIPTGISGPPGWLSPITHNAAFPQDGRGIEWYNFGGSAIPVGGTGTFHFTSNDSPAILAGNGWFPGFLVTHSVVYIGFPQTDPGFHFDVVVQTACVADFDDGSGTGTPDGGVGIEDLLYYLGIYGAGIAAADVDDGSGTGTHDGGVGIEDLLYYLGRYDLGC